MSGNAAGSRAAPVGSRVPRDRDGWRKARLGEIADCTLGKMLDRKKNHGTPRPYLANYNVRWGSFDLADVSLMPFEDVELEKYRLLKGDLAVCEGGEIGRCALWRDDNLEMFIQKAIHRVRAHADVCNSAYLYYWFLNSGRSDFFKQFTTGATILHLPRQNLVGIPVDLPPLPIQRKIAEILGAYDDLIENNRRRIALLEKMARELYRERFVRRKGKTYEKKPLGEVADITMGQSPDSSGYNAEGKGLPFHQGATGFGLRFPTNEMWSTEGKRYAQAGDILFSVRAPVGRINVSLEKIILGRGVSAMRQKEGFQSWLFYALKDHFCQEDMIGVGCVFASTTKDELFSVKIERPSDTEISDFEQISKPIDEAMLSLTLQNRNLARQRDRLLPRLMSGRLEVRE